jgi:hypothetical protein
MCQWSSRNYRSLRPSNVTLRRRLHSYDGTAQVCTPDSWAAWEIVPSGTVDGQYQDWTAVSQKLGQVTDAFRASIADGLPSIQDYVTSFISWSQNSGLSGFRPPLNGVTASMAVSLNTYAISQIIQTQGIVVSRAPDKMCMHYKPMAVSSIGILAAVGTTQMVCVTRSSGTVQTHMGSPNWMTLLTAITMK